MQKTGVRCEPDGSGIAAPQCSSAGGAGRCKTNETHWPAAGFIRVFCGRTGIRTLGSRKGTTVFETAPIGHSGIFPLAGFNDAKVCKIFNTSKTDFGYFEFVE